MIIAGLPARRLVPDLETGYMAHTHLLWLVRDHDVLCVPSGLRHVRGTVQQPPTLLPHREMVQHEVPIGYKVAPIKPPRTRSVEPRDLSTTNSNSLPLIIFPVFREVNTRLRTRGAEESKRPFIGSGTGEGPRKAIGLERTKIVPLGPQPSEISPTILRGPRRSEACKNKTI